MRLNEIYFDRRGEGVRVRSGEGEKGFRVSENEKMNEKMKVF